MRRQTVRGSRRLGKNSVKPFLLNWVRLTSLISKYQEYVKSRDLPLVLARLPNFLAYRRPSIGFFPFSISFLPCLYAGFDIGELYTESDRQFLYASNANFIQSPISAYLRSMEKFDNVARCPVAWLRREETRTSDSQLVSFNLIVTMFIIDEPRWNTPISRR